MTMGLRRCGRKSVGASSGSLRRPVAFNSLSICNARRQALCSPSVSWVSSKASSNAGENFAQHPMAPDDAVVKVATLAGYPFADIVHAGDQLLARNRGKEPGAQLVIGDRVI